MNMYDSLSLLKIIATTQALVWILLKLFMVDVVDPQLGGLKWGKGFARSLFGH